MHVLAIDAGTTGVTAIVYNEDKALGRAYEEFTQYYPQPGWVEHDADEIWEVTLRVAGAALEDAGVEAPDAVGITNQRETVLLWDETGPIGRAIVWQDRRTSQRCHDLQEHAPAIKAATGLILDPYFSATKVSWLLDHHDARRTGVRMGTIDSWLAWKLTGKHVTDPTNASRTMLWNIHTSRWDEAMLTLFDVPQDMLPVVVPSSQVIGPCHAFGGAPLAALVGDQQAALVGQGCIASGQAKNTYGTGCFLLQHTGDRPVDLEGILTTRAASLDDAPQYALEGSVFIGGAAVQWLRDGLQIIETAAAVNDLADQVDSEDGVVVVPAFAGLGAPHWDPDARGAMLGLTRGTTGAHIARATLRAVALQCDDLATAMQSGSGPFTMLRVDGGATASRLLMQFQADLLGVPVEVTATQATARGAALLAGHAVAGGKIGPPETRAIYQPSATREELARVRQRWRRAVEAVRSFGS